MINCVMTVKDRPKLTRQALETFVQNTDVEWTLTLIDDVSQPETRDLLRTFARTTKNVALLRLENSKGILGQLKNLGVYWSERYFPAGEWLVLVDNDVMFKPRWASRMACTEAWEHDIRVLGGARHPYHLPNKEWGWDGYDKGHVYESRIGQVIPSHIMEGWCETDAVAGYMHMMRWDTWRRSGPFDAHAPGVCQSEDFAFCRKVVESGGKVGYIWPPVIIHTGLTRTDGLPAVGAEAMERVEGVYYE